MEPISRVKGSERQGRKRNDRGRRAAWRGCQIRVSKKEPEGEKAGKKVLGRNQKGGSKCPDRGAGTDSVRSGLERKGPKPSILEKEGNSNAKSGELSSWLTAEGLEQPATLKGDWRAAKQKGKKELSHGGANTGTRVIPGIKEGGKAVL